MLTVHALDPAALDTHRAALQALLQDVVWQGASVGFLPPLGDAEAGAYWTSVRSALQEGGRLLWAAFLDGVLVGSVQLDLCQRANGANRAEVQKLIVHSRVRRAGIARALMAELERTAQARRRGLLYLDTEVGSGAEPFYRALGYMRIGELPQFACDTAGVWHATAVYAKTLFVRAAGDTAAG